jgi:hypothetical protein
VYKVSVERSYFSAQAHTNFRALTIAKLLREQAGRAGSQVALGKLSTTTALAANGPTAVCSKTPSGVAGICVSPPGRRAHRSIGDQLPGMGFAGVGVASDGSNADNCRVRMLADDRALSQAVLDPCKIGRAERREYRK